MKKNMMKNFMICSTLAASIGIIWCCADEVRAEGTESSENPNVVVWDDASGNWCVKNGDQVNTSYTGVAQNENGWWYIRDGYLDWDYTGLAENENGWWYINQGALDWTYTGLAENESGWWYVQNGALDWTYTGLAEKEDGQWYIQNGGLNSGYTGLIEDANGSHYIVNGKVNWSESDPEEAKLREYTEQVYSEVGRDLRACFNWVVNNMSYERHNGHITPPDGYTRCQWYSMMAFQNHRGNCYSYAGAFYYLAKYLGYDAEYVEGQVTRRGGGYTPHGWVEIDGRYICDPEGQAEISPYLNFYMMPKGNALLSYIR